MTSLPVDFLLQQSRFTRSTHRDIYPAIDPTSAKLSQAGRVIVITGASQGLGHLAFAKSFAAAGAKALVLASRDLVKLESVKRDIESKYPKVEIYIHSLDVKDPAAQEKFWKAVKDKYTFAHVLVSNAGIDPGSHPLKNIEEHLWWGGMEVNIRGYFLSCQHFLRLLPEDKDDSLHPTIITLSSSLAHGKPAPGYSHNSVAKLAAIQFGTYIAAEHPNVTVVSLHPGTVPTPIIDASFPSSKQFAIDTPELVGGTAVFLSTPIAKFLSGRYITANWDVEELVARKDEIVGQDKLKTILKGEFGPAQFA